jgi:RNA polymerase sigma factor (sigma-70 family)
MTQTIRAAPDSEATAFEAELRPLLGQALRLAAAMRLDASDAEDAVQEAALRAWRRRGNRRHGTDLRPWFLGIVANQCRESRRGRWATIVRVAEPSRRLHDDPAPAVGTFLDLRDALGRLAHPVRLAVVLRFYLDLPFDEVATISGCSPNAAKARVRRGLATLQSALVIPEDV